MPFYSTTKLEAILEFALPHPEVAATLPDLSDLRKCPRPWIINVIFTVMGQSFKDWIDDRIRQRNEDVVNEKNLGIVMDPAIL